jgi:hypothetical protein
MDDDGTYGARDLLTHLFSFYIGVAEVILREQPGDEPSFRNVVGLREARAAVATLAADDPLVQELDAWMKEEGIRGWEPRLVDGGWWSNLYYSCTRFRAFDETEQVRPFVASVVDLYVCA